MSSYHLSRGSRLQGQLSLNHISVVQLDECRCVAVIRETKPRQAVLEFGHNIYAEDSQQIYNMIHLYLLGGGKLTGNGDTALYAAHALEDVDETVVKIVMTTSVTTDVVKGNVNTVRSEGWRNVLAMLDNMPVGAEVTVEFTL